MLAESFKFPLINSILRWQDLFPTFNKVALISVAAALISIVVFMLAANKPAAAAPKGVRNLAEVSVEFIENEIIMPTLGKSGLGWTPFMLSLFLFVYLCNAPGMIPILYMPATARMAIPLFLSALVWLIFVGVGIKHQGARYFGDMIWPPGVPVALRPLVGVIEVISNLFVRPFSLTVRLFANMLAGHILLVTFSLLTHSLVTAQTKQFMLKPMAILPFFMLVFLTAFEVLVAFLQAYIFTILAAVYFAHSTHPEH